MQAAALGVHLLYGVHQDYLGAGGTTVGAPSSATEWQLDGNSTGGFTLKSSSADCGIAAGPGINSASPTRCRTARAFSTHEQDSCSAPWLPKNTVMNQVSRPFQIALVAVIAFFALWMVALKPSSSADSTPATPKPATTAAPASTQTSGNAILSAPAKARSAVAAANAASGAAASASTAGSSTAPVTSSSPSSSAAPPAAAGASATVTKGAASAKAQVAPAAGHAVPTRSAQQRLGVVGRAIDAHRVVAMLFYNPKAPDDRAVKQELAAVPSSGGKVVSLAVPLFELSFYPVVTSQVPVTMSPTLVIINTRRQASKIEGYADSFEISQRITDAVHGR
ncbi:MAG: hypothetical protein ACXVQR_05170 [Solirubrobacteraceae bacterium]